jgi:hypothetical protein
LEPKKLDAGFNLKRLHKKLDMKMRRQNQKIILLVNNAPTHALYETTRLTNITIQSLPPNTTAHFQPCD